MRDTSDSFMTTAGPRAATVRIRIEHETFEFDEYRDFAGLFPVNVVIELRSLIQGPSASFSI